MSSQDTPSSEAYRRAREPRIVQVDKSEGAAGGLDHRLSRRAWLYSDRWLALRRGVGGDLAADAGTAVVGSARSYRAFVIGTFFFVAGLFAPVEMARHGVSSFVRTRTLRLGVPWLLFTVLVWPLFM